jgi:FkbH-like protein
MDAQENLTVPAKERKVKCVVWDLDHTLWDGVLLEDGVMSLRDNVEHIVRMLDQRGILQSVASKNDYDAAFAKLNEFGIAEYFLYPQIHWQSKSASVGHIAKQLNIGMDTIAFIDDQPFEREEVSHVHPEVLCLDASITDRLLELPELNPRFITEDSAKRRLLYMSEQERKQAEEMFDGPQEAFLASLRMVFTIAPAAQGDLERAEELTVRTNQLNTTGYTYTYEELDRFRCSDRHVLLMAGLTDKYGDYGKIGLAVVERTEASWTLKLLLMSCRVMSRGVGSIMLHHLIRLACEAGVKLMAEFVPNAVNRMMYVTYKFAGFQEAGRRGDVILLEYGEGSVPNFPDYVDVQIEEVAYG